MMKRKQKTPVYPKQRLIYEGPIGLCPCCNKPTEIRIASTMGEPSVPWIVPDHVLHHLYSAVAPLIKEKNGVLYVTDPSTYDATVRTKLFFVDGEDGMAGPFGQTGLKVFLGTSFTPLQDNIRVYVVSTNHRSLSIICKSPYSAPISQEGHSDDSVDVF